MQPNPKLGIGLEKIAIDQTKSEQELLAAVGIDNELLYGDKRFHTLAKKSGFVPAHVAFDKVVCDGQSISLVFSLCITYHRFCDLMDTSNKLFTRAKSNTI